MTCLYPGYARNNNRTYAPRNIQSAPSLPSPLSIDDALSELPEEERERPALILVDPLGEIPQIHPAPAVPPPVKFVLPEPVLPEILRGGEPPTPNNPRHIRLAPAVPPLPAPNPADPKRAKGNPRGRLEENRPVWEGPEWIE
ncbi:MAG: hypothetical protein LBD99_03440 [Candidatus Margulisbacteria bacterium]|jgi:hypothetical protein|nr:hypothetical protein [Candidatus Margulisiibacteriota bacterium]